ncbi:MAG: hypothetical protein LBG25_04195 [Spirochaetaceae bacterium]|jgi:hypothetical protein|nr:hypothetical protein [Spirochaetaceae bacterium]
MNKKILYGMIALLSVSFLFLGCPTGTSSDSTTATTWSNTGNGTLPPPNPGQAAAALASALGTGVLSSDSTVIIPNGVRNCTRIKCTAFYSNCLRSKEIT